jgi:tetratricopeptide (TPR) repeat protein
VIHTAKNSFFICDLAGSDPRQTHVGAIKIVPRLTAAAIIDAARSNSHRKLAESIRVGEWAQSVRSAEGLARASQDILNLPLGKAANSIGRYYYALSLNRQGPRAFAEADKILTDVGDHGPLPFRARAFVARGTIQRRRGDDREALVMYTEAARIAGSSEHGDLQPVFLAAYQAAFMKYDEGDHCGALADLQRLQPLASRVGLFLPAFLHNYYNSLAGFLMSCGRLEEASRLRPLLLTSPFRNAYPELERTCADIALKTGPRRHSFVSMSVAKPFTGEPGVSTEPPRRKASSGAEIILFLLVLNLIRRQRRRMSVRLFSGLPLGRLLLAARVGALCRRRARAQLGPSRWSYLRVFPAYPRPPNV